LKKIFSWKIQEAFQEEKKIQEKIIQDHSRKEKNPGRNLGENPSTP
jgi:hypothetical protein